LGLRGRHGILASTAGAFELRHTREIGHTSQPRLATW